MTTLSSPLIDTSASVLEHLDFDPGPDPSPLCEARAALLAWWAEQG